MKPIIFDMDGVIIDSEPIYDKGATNFLASKGYKITKDVLNGLRGTTTPDFWAAIIDHLKMDEPIDDIINQNNVFFDRIFESSDEVKEVAGATLFLESVVNSGNTVALASSSGKRRIDIVLKRLRVSHFFVSVTSGDEVRRGKPDPEIFLRAATKMNVKPADCVVVEDSSAGVRAAKLAGMTCIGFTGTIEHDQDLSEADAVVGSFHELTSHLRGAKTHRV